jgi:AraC family transcriptional regulator
MPSPECSRSRRVELRDDAIRAILPVMNMPVDGVGGPIVRELAWRLLRDVSTLLGRESEAIGADAPPSQSIARGLAAWQTTLALEYIERNLGSKLTIREMADCVALSMSHFARAFKRRLGCTPMAYVAMRRVERAKLMMISTRERLATIALACGFADQPHFSKQFRRAVGVSPALWRRASARSSV